MSGVLRTSWLRPAPFHGTPASLAEHVEAIGAMMRGEGRLWLGPFAPPASLPAELEQTALVVPTSGSTGGAKAVALALSALVASQDATARRLGGDAGPARGHGLWLPLLPPTHIAGIQVIARAWRAAELRDRPGPLLPGELPALATHFDADAFTAAAEPALAEAEALGVAAFTSLVPTQLARLLADRSRAGARAIELLGRFEAVLLGGAATPPALLGRSRAAGVAACTTYGSSETAGGCVYDGAPLDGVRLRLADPGSSGDGGAAVSAPDGAGRLVIASPTLALGYVHANGTAEAGTFRTSPEGREFVTSDLARIEDGRLEILGRADDVIVTGGRKVLPQDVERALDAHPDLEGRLAGRVVVGVPDPEWGERLVALVAPTPGTSAAERTMLAELVPTALRHSLLPAHAVPKTTLLVEEIPLLGIGKIDRSAARRIASSRCR